MDLSRSKGMKEDCECMVLAISFAFPERSNRKPGLGEASTTLTCKFLLVIGGLLAFGPLSSQFLLLLDCFLCIVKGDDTTGSYPWCRRGAGIAVRKPFRSLTLWGCRFDIGCREDTFFSSLYELSFPLFPSASVAVLSVS